MIQSMTGFAAGDRDIVGATLHLELRSVNSRFLDVTFRCADEVRFLEMPIREQIAARVQRGKVECRLHLLTTRTAAPRELAPNIALVEQLGRLERSVREILPQAAPLSVAEVLRWPDVLGDEAIDPSRMQAECAALMGDVLDEFVASRVREGARLAEMILERVRRMRALLEEVNPMIPQALADYEARLAARLKEAVAGFDEERIRQEIGVFATRIDVAEELSRLATHLDEVERVVTRGGGVGKRLDFLMQELNREANTLASKSVAAEVTAIALDLKLLIEQMREQIQNLE
ncbi:MAG: YicC family protein [Candidatus Nitricoxidivorans perseverans]|uniref:YicC family protein n=1 Tax=Candidatus Nitricoxidivorans perseverans TaxID=2975601 RepID=A0AA49IXE5_9PROT|nr:MAG: YicC family protein [Candidatus Nitricoxidivorans perseverans]